MQNYSEGKSMNEYNLVKISYNPVTQYTRRSVPVITPTPEMYPIVR